MSGGIDWFRWHHGSVTDQKFQLVARKSGASVAEVIAVWATILEAASSANDRGNPGDMDFDSVDCALGIEDGKSARIYMYMADRGLIDEGGCVTSWGKRQPKREREDDGAAARKRNQRARDAESGVTEESRTSHAEENHVTPCHAMSRQKTPREEERREVNHIVGDADKLPAGFVRFWELWPSSPRKVAKAQCAKKWRTAKLDSSADQIIAHVGVMKGTKQWTDGFDPAPLTYLNQRRWEDGMPTTQSAPSGLEQDALFRGCL